MTAILAKDLRLALDVVRPWALIVAGFVLLGLAAVSAPSDLAPDVLRDVGPRELLVFAAILVAASAVAVGAWGAAAMVQGDDAHGARYLAATLPATRRSIMASKLTTLVSIVVLATLVAGAAALAGGARTTDARLIVAAALVGGACGAGLSLLVSSVVRGAFAAVLVTLLVGMLVAATSWLACQATFGWFVRDLRELAQWTSAVEPWELVAAGERARARAAAGGLCVAATLAAVVGAWRIGRAPDPRVATWTLAGGLALALALGVAQAAWSSSNDRAIAFWDVVVQRDVASLDDAALAEEVRALLSVSGSWQSRARWAWHEAHQRRGRMSPAEWLASPIRTAALEAPGSAEALSLLGNDDPAWLEHAIRLVLAQDGRNDESVLIARSLLCMNLALRRGAPMPAFVERGRPASLDDVRQELLEELDRIEDAGSAEQRLIDELAAELRDERDGPRD